MSSLILPALLLLSAFNMVMPLYYDVAHSSNAFRDQRSTQVTFYKAADGKCYKRVVTLINGVKNEDNLVVDCKVAAGEIKKQQERTQRKINEEFNRLNKEIEEAQRRIEDQFKNFMKFDWAWI